MCLNVKNVIRKFAKQELEKNYISLFACLSDFLVCCEHSGNRTWWIIIAPLLPFWMNVVQKSGSRNHMVIYCQFVSVLAGLCMHVCTCNLCWYGTCSQCWIHEHSYDCHHMNTFATAITWVQLYKPAYVSVTLNGCLAVLQRQSNLLVHFIMHLCISVIWMENNVLTWNSFAQVIYRLQSWE